MRTVFCLPTRKLRLVRCSIVDHSRHTMVGLPRLAIPTTSTDALNSQRERQKQRLRAAPTLSLKRSSAPLASAIRNWPHGEQMLRLVLYAKLGSMQTRHPVHFQVMLLSTFLNKTYSDIFIQETRPVHFELKPGRFCARRDAPYTSPLRLQFFSPQCAPVVFLRMPSV